MREFVHDAPSADQGKVLTYLRSGLVLGVTIGADLTDWLDPPHKANPIIDGQPRGGITEMTDGTWFWHAGLIHFIEKYNLPVSPEFVAQAARHNWVVNKDEIPAAHYEPTYFELADGSRGGKC
jgi:hypothetical protein